MAPRAIYGPGGEVLKHVHPKAKSMVAFDAAGTGRRLSTWQPPRGLSMASIARSDARDLRDRSRDAVRKSLYAAAACQSWVGNIVGTGISPSPVVADDELRETIKSTWEEWTDEADAEGQADFYGLQRTVARALFEAGEIFVRFRPRYIGDGLIVPIQLQLIEAEQVPIDKNEVLPNGNIVRMGVEFDRQVQSRRVAYWVYRSHPGDYGWGVGQPDLVRVPASEMLHIYDPLRYGQVRGIPKLATSLLTLYELDKFSDATLVKQTIGAGYTGFFTWAPKAVDPMGEPMDAQKPAGGEDDSIGFVTVEPGTFQELPPGADIKFATPPDIGAQYEAFMKVQLRAIASSLDVMYEQLTGDYAGVTYSSVRAGVLEVRRRLEQFQHDVLVFQLCRPVWQRWFREAVLSGALPITATDYQADQRKLRAARWLPDPWPWVDPLKDRAAEILAVRSGVKSLSQVIEQEGDSASETLRQLAQDLKLATDLGLILDTNPATTAKTGVLQNFEDAAAAEAR